MKFLKLVWQKIGLTRKFLNRKKKKNFSFVGYIKYVFGPVSARKVEKSRVGYIRRRE